MEMNVMSKDCQKHRERTAGKICTDESKDTRHSRIFIFIACGCKVNREILIDHIKSRYSKITFYALTDGEKICGLICSNSSINLGNFCRAIMSIKICDNIMVDTPLCVQCVLKHMRNLGTFEAGELPCHSNSANRSKNVNPPKQKDKILSLVEWLTSKGIHSRSEIKTLTSPEDKDELRKMLVKIPSSFQDRAFKIIEMESIYDASE